MLTAEGMVLIGNNYDITEPKTNWQFVTAESAPTASHLIRLISSELGEGQIGGAWILAPHIAWVAEQVCQTW